MSKRDKLEMLLRDRCGDRADISSVVGDIMSIFKMTDKAYRHGNGPVYKRSMIIVWTDGEDVIVPQQELFNLDSEIEGDEGHSCDQMGCGQEHIVARFKFPKGCHQRPKMQEAS